MKAKSAVERSQVDDQGEERERTIPQARLT